MSRDQAQRRRWTASTIARLVRDYPHTPAWTIARAVNRPLSAVYGKAFTLGLKKSAEFLRRMHAACCLRDAGEHYRFTKGHVPANKGLRRPGWGPGRMKETQFKPGNYSKRWDREAYCIGALRVNTDGGLDIKVREGLRAWDPMARWVWTTERGPIPKGMVVRCRNGDDHDTRIQNLRLATRRELMLENTLHNYPKPIAHAIQLRGALNRRINRLEEQRAQNA